MRATVQKGVTLNGADAACVKCHRRSGLGGSEGQNPIRPIAGRLLFSQPKVERAGRWATPAGSAAVRPPYTRASLARALREGIDPAGRPLDALMPRYDLSDEEIAQLHAYLEGLSSTAAPGVTDREIHFSTIITPDVSSDRRSAMLDVMQGFFRDKNGGTRKETRRREVGNEQMYRAFRTWVLHVWELKGAPETWGAQLEAYYRQQPVFAVIGGIGGGSWQPVHAFCEAFEVPCVFPDVDYPDVDGNAATTRFISRAASRWKRRCWPSICWKPTRPARLEQSYRYTATMPWGVCRRRRCVRLSARQERENHHRLSARGRRPHASRIPGNGWPAKNAQACWLYGWTVPILGRLIWADAPPPGLSAIYVSASLSAMRRPNLPEHWLSKLHMVYPFDLPATREQRLTRMKAWLRARNIPLSDERTQANAFFAATVTGDAVSHLRENFSRDYFIERIEQMTQTSLSPSIYPHLSLGPGQRFASKGGYVVRFPEGTTDAPVPVSDWLIP